MQPFAWQSLTPQPVIGVDEVGRGCLAGPVLAAAVILDPKKDHSEFTDSKLLSAKRREEITTKIQRDHRFGIGFATVAEIEKFNILGATFLAMRRALKELGEQGGHILVDGHMLIPGLGERPQTALVKGDLRAAPVAAASILAKVTRDRWMVELEEQYPGYGFAQHKGYGTKAHLAAIASQGPSREHRRLFAGVREHWANLG